MGNPSLGNTPSDQGYQLPFKFHNQSDLTFNYGKSFMTGGGIGTAENPFDDYEQQGVIISGNYPWFAHKTLVSYGTEDGARMSSLLINSGNLAHDHNTTDPSSTLGTKFERVDGYLISAHGSWTGTTYVPDVDWHGEDSFKWKVWDGNGYSNEDNLLTSNL